MAKITYAKLLLQENDVGDNFWSEIVAEVNLAFTQNEIRSKAQFQMHLFLFRMGKENERIDSKKEIAFSNMDTDQVAISNILAYKKIFLKTCSTTRVVRKVLCPLPYGNALLDGIKVYATLIPVEAGASKWSNTYFFDLILK